MSDEPMSLQRELEIAQMARQALEQILFDGPVPDDGHLIVQRAIQLRKIEAAAREMREYVGYRDLQLDYARPDAKLCEWDDALGIESVYAASRGVDPHWYTDTPPGGAE